MRSFDHAARIARARELMDRDGVDVLLLSLGADLPYLSGYEAIASERLTMLVVPRKGDAVLVVPRLEAPRVAEGPFELHPWDETEDPVPLVADLSNRPLVAAIGDQTWSVFLLELLSVMTETTFVSASRLTTELRIRKDPAELDALRAAGAAADRVARRIPSEIRFAGRTEREVARDVAALTVEEGHDEALFWIVASGPNAASPHHEPGSRVIERGDPVVIDFGGSKDGYCSDTTRTFVVGEPSDELVRVHAVVAEAQAAGRAAARSGVTAETVDRAARQVIDDAGYGEHFVHRTGHGIGLDVHEHPYLVEGNRRRLEPGMVFSIEPGIYLPGRLGVRIEDICVCTGDGAEPLNDSPRELVPVE